MARFKVSDKMIDAGEAALKRCVEDYAMANMSPIPDWEGMDQKSIEQGRVAVRAVIQAAADCYIKEPKT